MHESIVCVINSNTKQYYVV